MLIWLIYPLNFPVTQTLSYLLTTAHYNDQTFWVKSLMEYSRMAHCHPLEMSYDSHTLPQELYHAAQGNQLFA